MVKELIESAFDLVLPANRGEPIRCPLGEILGLRDVLVAHNVTRYLVTKLALIREDLLLHGLA
jgi:hypothetical protein